MVARDDLLDAAFEALVHDGPAFATDPVVRRAGVSKGLLFHHFGTRDGLLDAMAARVLTQTQEGLGRLEADYPNPRERLAALARTLLEDPRASTLEVRRIHLFWLMDAPDGTCRGAARDALLTDFVSATIRDGIATGAMRPGIDPRLVAHMLLTQWHGVTTRYAAGAPVDFDIEAERAAATAMDAVAPP